MTLLNKNDEALRELDLSPYRREWCCVCGKPRQHGHHAIPRSHGGEDRDVISLCADCHHFVHQSAFARLSFMAKDGALYASLEVIDQLTTTVNLARRVDVIARAWGQA